MKDGQIDHAADAAQRVVDVHRELVGFLRVGQTLPEIDAFVARTLDSMGCKSAFYHYRNGPGPVFPSHACLSVNDCIVHGTASSYEQPMREGDLLKIDIGVKLRGWIGDAAWTYSFGEPDETIRALMDCGKESLRRGVEQLRPGNRYIDWARAVQGYVEDECGFHLTRGLGGHGIGLNMLHGPPFVANALDDASADKHRPCKPGTLIAVEPMLSVGTPDRRDAFNDWPIYTADGSFAAHYEHDVLITEDGPRVLTEGLDELDDVVRR